MNPNDKLVPPDQDIASVIKFMQSCLAKAENTYSKNRKTSPPLIVELYLRTILHYKEAIVYLKQLQHITDQQNNAKQNSLFKQSN